MAFGSGSITVAITSMASSLEFPESPFFLVSVSNRFAIISFAARTSLFACPSSTLRHQTLTLSPRWPAHFFRPRQNPRTVRGHRDGVLEMRGRAAIRGLRGPLIAHAHFRTTCIHHGLDGNDHTFLQPRAASRIAIVRQVGLIVHFRSDAMPRNFPHDRISVLLGAALDCVADLAQPIARAHFFDR